MSGDATIDVTLAPNEALSLDSQLDAAFRVTAALSHKELNGQCELIVTQDHLLTFYATTLLRMKMDDPELVAKLRSFVSEFGIVIDE
jgi:hypothetical protein